MTAPDEPKSPSATEQAERFREAARALECDDDEARFDARLKKLAKAPPKADAAKPADPD